MPVRERHHVVTCLSAAAEPDDRVSLPAPRQGIDKDPFSAVAETQPQKLKRNDYPNRLFHHLLPVEPGLDVRADGVLEQGRVIPHHADGGAYMIAVNSVFRQNPCESVNVRDRGSRSAPRLPQRPSRCLSAIPYR